MKFTRVYFFSGTNKKDGDSDFLDGYKAENGLFIKITQSFDGACQWYEIGEKSFATLKAAKKYVESFDTVAAV